MYYFEATVYEGENEDRCWGELWMSQEKSGEPLMTAHIARDRRGRTEEDRHARIMWLIRIVCYEIAQNLDDGLF